MTNTNIMHADEDYVSDTLTAGGDRAVWERTAVEEGFVVDIQGFLQELLDARGMKRVDLANAMGISRARVTQIFSDDCKNLTVRLFARAVHALGDIPVIDGERARGAREALQNAFRLSAIHAADNVHPLWHDRSPGTVPADQECQGDDARLDAIVASARRAGGRG